MNKIGICLIWVVVFCLALGLDVALTYGFVWLIDKAINTSLLDNFWWVYLLLIMIKLLFCGSVRANG